MIQKHRNRKKPVLCFSKTIKRSQTILYGIAGLNILVLIASFLNNTFSFTVLIYSFFFSSIFLLCGVCIKKNPLVLNSFALFVLISTYSLTYTLKPSLFFKGMPSKIIMVSAVIYSIYLTIKTKNLKKTPTLN